jgi:hypothetical protein
MHLCLYIDIRSTNCPLFYVHQPLCAQVNSSHVYFCILPFFNDLITLNNSANTQTQGVPLSKMRQNTH